jgi:hypothetical protein
VIAKGKYIPFEITSLASAVLKMSLNTRKKVKLSNLPYYWEVVLFDPEGLTFRLLWPW